MIILGITDNHDSGACIIKDGNIVAAVSEERLNREKLTGCFPFESIDAVLELAKVGIDEVDTIALASFMTPSVFLRLVSDFYNKVYHEKDTFQYLLNVYILYHVLCYRMRIPFYLEKKLSQYVIASRLKKKYKKFIPVIPIEHHYAHAASCYYTCGSNDRQLIITADAMGDALSLTVNIGHNRHIRRIYAQTGMSALSVYYTRLTKYLGFTPLRHEGKITGLAAYGSFQKSLYAIARSLLNFSPEKGCFNSINHFLKVSPKSKPYKQLGDYAREDVAYNFQLNFEKEIAAFVKYWILKTNIHQICLAGGAFANVCVNKRINKLDSVERLYIFPHMGDGGLSVGAALGYVKPHPFALNNVYLGNNEKIDNICQYLNDMQLQYELFSEYILCKKIAQLLFDGYVVAHCNGKMEYGPRALGNRSVLYRADDPTCKEWLNKKLARSFFMPFAPLSLEEEASQLYIDIEKMKYTLPFMNCAVECTDYMKKIASGAIHVDGTARPQIMNENINKRIYIVLQEYKKLKGTSVVINTSFNRHEEPIVCSAGDAIHSFVECELDYLVIGNYLVSNKEKGGSW